jgi:hypothetical protein
VPIVGGVLLFLSWLRDDWLGMDILEDMKRDGVTWIRRLRVKRYRFLITKWCVNGFLFVPDYLFRFMLFLLKKGDAFSFIILSIQMSPFITTAYLRHGQTGKLTRRDWMIYLSSGVLSNTYWTLRSWGIVIILQFIADRLHVV